MPQVNAAELYVSLEASVDNSTEVVQETSTALQFTALDDGCTTMEGYALGGYAMGGYTLPSQDYVANTGETLYSQETHLEEEGEDLSKTKIMLRMMVKILMIWINTKRGLSKATLRMMWMSMKSFLIL